jgi:hypothetical protein
MFAPDGAAPGLISFELFGHLHNVVFERDQFFGYQTQRMADYVGL